jgi:hypothetical protein
MSLRPLFMEAVAVPFVIPTRISCHAALDVFACAPFCICKGRRMRCTKATKSHRKSGRAQSRDLRFSGPVLEMFSTCHPSLVARIKSKT